MSLCPNCQVDNGFDAAICKACGASLFSWITATGIGATARPKVTVRVVRSDGGPETIFTLKKDEVIVGSAGEVLFVDDPFVARQQARIRFEGSDVVVEDIGGGCGVFTRLRSERPIRVGQEIRCGRQRLLYETLPPLPANASPRVWGSPDDGCRGRLVQLLEGGMRGNAFMLKDGDNLLGREVGDLTFPGDGFVSGRHAVFRVGAEGVTVRDIGSVNGTFLRIEAPTPVSSGDQFLIGRHLLKIDLASG